MKLLLTGFDPFGEDIINPSWEAVKRIPDRVGSIQIVRRMLPTCAYQSLQCIKEAINLEDPDVILSIGQAKGRAAISVERIGINVNDFRIPDNGQHQYVNEPIFQDGPDAYFSNLPIYAMVKGIQMAGIEAVISNTAGTFVCNHVLYGTRYMIEHEFPNKRSGFIHIPCLKEQVSDSTPYMELEDIITGLCAAIQAIAEGDAVVNSSEGTLD